MKKFILLALAVCGTFAGAQFQQFAAPLPPSSLFTTYLDLGPSSAQPFAAYLEKKGTTPLKIDLSALPVTLTPVTPMSGQPSKGTLSGPAAYDVPGNRPGPRQMVPLSFTSDAPAGVYRMNVSLPGGHPLYAPVVALNPGVQARDPRQVGQTFVHLGGNAVFRQGAKELGHAPLIGKLFTLKSVTESGATFSVEGIGNVTWTGDWNGNFPGLMPVVDDSSLDIFRKTLIGQPVWMYGGLNVYCRVTPSTSANLEQSYREPMRVKRILRLTRPQWSGAQRYLGLDNGGADLIAFTPVLVQLERPRTARVVSASGAGDPAKNGMNSIFKDALTTPACQTLNLILADTWSLPRTFSATAPSRRVPVEPKEVKGLDRWQYAWLKGFPSASYGPREELLKLNQWQYINIPFPITVTFTNGKVSEVVEPRLP